MKKVALVAISAAFFGLAACHKNSNSGADSSAAPTAAAPSAPAAAPSAPAAAPTAPAAAPSSGSMNAPATGDSSQ